MTNTVCHSSPFALCIVERTSFSSSVPGGVMSVTLSVAGGIVGTALGFLLAWAISKASPLPASVQAWSVALGIGITAVVGLVFGVYPALRAAKLDPIEALRRE